MDKNNRNNINPLRSRWRKAALAAALTAGLMTAAPAMACFFGGVVFDPSNFVEHILEVSAALQRIARMESQLQNQERMLASLGTNAWPGMAQSMQGVTLVLQNGGRFASADSAGQMAANDRLETQLAAQDQSRLAYHTAVSQWVMHDWNNTPNCQPIQDLFGN